MYRSPYPYRININKPAKSPPPKLQNFHGRSSVETPLQKRHGKAVKRMLVISAVSALTLCVGSAILQPDRSYHIELAMLRKHSINPGLRTIWKNLSPAVHLGSEKAKFAPQAGADTSASGSEEVTSVPYQLHEIPNQQTAAAGSHAMKGAQPKALIFTMDAFESHENASRRGGASGELTVRRSLETGLAELGFQVDVLRTDQEFERKTRTEIDSYAAIFLDPWTWAAPGWILKSNLRKVESKLYILDFFGGTDMHGLQLPPERMLTAFNTTKSNTFLGYYLNLIKKTRPRKKAQGVVWGKDPKHFEGKMDVLRYVAELADVHSTLSYPIVEHPRIHYHGHLASGSWRALLAESRFLLGLGHPLLGPSAIDAISVGTVLINPMYDKPVQGYFSQHPHAAKKIGAPYVCTVRPNELTDLKACVETALGSDLPPYNPPEFTKEAYIERLRAIVGPQHGAKEGVADAEVA